MMCVHFFFVAQSGLTFMILLPQLLDLRCYDHVLTCLKMHRILLYKN